MTTILGKRASPILKGRGADFGLGGAEFAHKAPILREAAPNWRRRRQIGGGGAELEEEAPN